jgi:hypothetical protein
MHFPYREMAGTWDGGRVLDVPAHLLSRGLMSQSPSVTCCTLASVGAFVLHVNTVFTWSILLF